MYDEFDAYSVLRADCSSSLSDYLRCFPDPDQLCPPSSISGDLFKHFPSLLCVAAYFGSLSCLRLLIARGAFLCFRDRRGRTPVHFAIAGGQLPSLQILIENGGEIETVDGDGNGAVHFAVMHRSREALLWIGAATNLSMSPRNRRKVTPLHIAATEKLSEFVRILCNWGADTNSKTVCFCVRMFVF
jgi:ankyrin repeat protein